MATVKKTKEKKEKKLTKDDLISLYMDQVLEREEFPGTVYRFCKDHDLKEEDFYQFFGSFSALEKGIWELFFEHTMNMLQKSKEYEAYSNREKMLTFYFTFFELLSVNRSYVLFALKRHKAPLKNMEQLKGLRKQVKGFARDLIRDANESKQVKLLKQSEMIFAEGAWIQMLFLLKFWMDDNSPRFESTDVAIEKSVNTVFEIFDNTPLERVLDFGKFLWKEKMA
ncbi:TetR family transcriptional regulator C-terminal domain-containing protein [Salinimicrobium soli]|uniref:TetR family transcriptional regulator C-terminal domain-containing protein n=1 Tax=Salinimicrobium soli TaxID=1254399 RepID=UPI003AADC390